MRSWKRWVAIGSGALASLWCGATAFAQEEEGYEGAVPALRDVLLNITSRVDAKMGTWVDGNALTDPEGQEFISDLAAYIGEIVSRIADILQALLAEFNYL